MIGLHTKSLSGLKQLTDPENYVPDQSSRSGPSRRFQPTGDGGGGGGWSNFELLSEAEVYLGCREDSMALAMSWLKVDEARTEGRGILADECVQRSCEVDKELNKGASNESF